MGETRESRKRKIKIASAITLPCNDKEMAGFRPAPGNDRIVAFIFWLVDDI
jgi:hypothetical protein